MARQYGGSEIAIIGMACRFPGAENVEQFWRNLCAGVESLTTLSDEELRRSGVEPALYRDPCYVRRVSVLDDVESFAADFFGYTPAEARLIDPQQRLFMECSWEALERAGYNPGSHDGAIGVFAGAKTDTYLFNIVGNRELMASLDTFRIALGNDLASMATQISYRFDLTGPSYGLHTACSTSLVAVHLACQSLLLDECRMALAGGAAINVPQRRGYLYQPGGLLSPDGRCRSFDNEAGGTAFGNGVGVVVLKRLEDALADGDHIHAVILGTATNNDGAEKASYTAPGVDGQANVILEALACAEVAAESLSYIETHGTATPLGDAIELLALKQAFRTTTAEKGFCALGSVKSNFGHLETAAGVAGLIKTALALEHKMLPPSLHFQRPPEGSELDQSPFYVNTELRPWSEDRTPRRAGLSSFGIGSTNAHAILEEPPLAETTPSRPWQLLLFSARSATALETATANLAAHLREGRVEGASDDEADQAARLADTAFTLQVGRRRFAHRRAVVCRDLDDAVALLETPDPQRVFSKAAEEVDPPVALLLPGLGDQAVGMARELYRTEATFRESLDRCAELLKPELELDLREVIYPPETATPGAQEAKGPDLRRLLGRGGAGESERERRLVRTEVAQPAMFALEYALAQLWMEWGIHPQAMIGYSLGEYVAACLAGVLSLDDALTLVARRARMIAHLPAGAMLGVSLPAAELEALIAEIGPEISLAASNGPSLAVAAGDPQAIAELDRRLGERDVACRLLATTHAFHSRSLEPISDELTALAKTLSLKPPEIPYLSNLTGTWITPQEATDPGYWARHMCQPVRFEQGIRDLLADPRRVLLELGSGQSLTSFVKVHPACTPERTVVHALPGAWDRRDDAAFTLATLGRLWLAGVDIDWSGVYAHERRRRLPLPTYPFERQRYWVDPDSIREIAAADSPVRITLDKQAELDDWLWCPVWKAAPRPEATPTDGGCWLLLGDSEALAESLRESGREVVEVSWTDGFHAVGTGAYTLAADRAEDYVTLFETLRAEGREIRHLVHCAASPAPDGDAFEQVWNRGFLSLIFLAQAVGRLGLADPARPLAVTVVTAGSYCVSGDEALVPETALMVGPCKVIPQEFPGLTCRQVDLLPGVGEAEGAAVLAAELSGDGGDEEVVAYRQGERFVRRFERLGPEETNDKPLLKEQGTYLLTGGLGGLGLALAQHLAERYQARLVLTGRSPLPAPEDWNVWLEGHGDDDPVSVKIRKLRALEESGSEILALAADVADVAEMTRVRDCALERFGRIDGVVHLAGIPGGGVIQLKTSASASAIVAPKVRGALVLADVLSEVQPDFVVLYSSIASVLGEFGQVDYCGANAFLDVFASHWRGRGQGEKPMVVTINWDIWREVGLAAYTEVPEHLRAWRHEMLEKGITSAEGVEVFERILARAPGRDLPQVIVSTQEIHDRIELGKSFTGERFLEQFGSGHAAAPAAPAAALISGSETERCVTAVWQRVLGREELRPDDNFFDLGGNSLLGMQLVNDMNRELGTRLSPVDLFEHPSIGALVRHLAPESAADAVSAARPAVAAAGDEMVAIIGMAGRFPGAESVDKLWCNLRDGKDSFVTFSEDELLASGVDPTLIHDPCYVPVGAILEDVEKFDAGLFGYSPREAEIMDPQHRFFLECAWEALESAGYDSQRYTASVGVFGGSSINTYIFRFQPGSEAAASVEPLQLIIGNDKDSLTTSVSYKLDLRGPSIAVQTFCSTSLVAVHMAVRSLLGGECTMALAGGVTVSLPQKSGYRFQEGSILAPDGRCRPFDADALGIVSGSGVGLVVLKRLRDALADGDTIHAVIRGSAINNDGSVKAGYTAPSVGAQAEVVAAALRAAGVSAETIDYVEAHGTGTPLGDPIEVTALTRAFRETTNARGYCGLGSVKGNVGHIDRAAGVTGLIKTVLALKHRQIPPSLHFERPNPKIDFASSPFYVNAELREWPQQDNRPRRAGISSLGFGGTNAHVIVEEAPELTPSDAPQGAQLLLLSGRTATAREAVAGRLADFLEAHPGLNLADVAFTLQVGRRELEHRRALVADDPADAVAVLRSVKPERSWDGVCKPGQRQAVFLFPGQGSQYPGMGEEVYWGEPIFRRELDRCCEILSPLLESDLRKLLYPEPEAVEEAGERLAQTAITQPALFAVEYALARMWMAWGIRPEVMIGHSIGEYVAACLAGVFSLEDALALVAERGRLIQELPGGEMLGVPLTEENLLPRLEGTELSWAAINAPDRQVVSGTAEAIGRFAEELAAEGIDGRRLRTSHAFHSAMLEPVVEPFARRVAEVERRPPSIPFFSCLTGTLITGEEATDPAYWAAQLRQGVRFSAGVTEILEDPSRVLLEVGPGSTLTTLIRRHLERGSDRAVVSSLPGPKEKRSARVAAFAALGRLWLAGLSPDWSAVHGPARRRRIPLPTYPFERQRFWVEEAAARVGQGALTAGRRPQEWLFTPGWKSSPPPRGMSADPTRYESGWLLLSDGSALAEALAKGVEERNWPVTVAFRGDRFADRGHGVCTLRPQERDYDALLETLREPPSVVLYLWSLETAAAAAESIDGLLHLARSLSHRPSRETIALWVLTDGLHDALAQDGTCLQKSSLLAACRAINRGYGHLVCRHLDLLIGPDCGARLPEQILAEVLTEPSELTIAYWRGRRWVPVTEAVAREESAAEELAEALPEGTYLVTGGLAEPGFSVAASLSSSAGTRLLLLEPDPLPPRREWAELDRERAPSAEELNAFLATLAAENGIGVDMAVRGAKIPERMQQLAGEVEREDLPEGFDALSDALCAAYAWRFFARQVDVAAGTNYQRRELLRSLKVVPQFERFFHYLLHVLDRAEMVELDGDAVTFREVPEERTDAEALGKLAAERYPALRPGIECIAHCAAHYPEAFRGKVEPVSVLFPNGSPEMIRQVMETQARFSVNRIFYPLMAELIREVAAGLCRPLRILEFGAGDGNLTWELAEALRDSNVEYHFTDIGRAFVVAGRKAAAQRGLDFMRFGVLDVTRDPADQGYERYSFDVLVTFDVVHATPRIRETMRNLKRLLTPGGWTMLLEPSRDQHWITLIWGLAEGWWLFADEERTLHPLLEPRRWEEVLADLGFSFCGVYPLDPAERAVVDHSLLVVQQGADLRAPNYLEMAVGRWQERRRKLAERIRRVGELERRGTEVELVAADCANADAVTAAVGRARERWGALTGVVHAAGPWNGSAVGGDELDPATYGRIVAANTATLAALERGLAAEKPELALLVSPLQAAADDAPAADNAADLLLCAYASREGEQTLPWRSLAWGVPVDGGSAAGGLSPHLGAAALAGAVRHPELRRLLVTHRPPVPMAAAWNRIPASTADATGAGGDGYVPPVSEEQQRVAGMWQEILGIERIGLHDNFFELGGDSLILTQLHSRILDAFEIEMPVEKLFELPSVEAQAAAVVRIRDEEKQRDHEEILAIIAEMSDEEVEETLLKIAQ